MKTISGFHAIEEILKNEEKQNRSFSGFEILYSGTGPRVKSILKQAEKLNISISNTDGKTLDSYVSKLPTALRDHRGIILLLPEDRISEKLSETELTAILAEKQEASIIILDSITDPHNIGSIVRSAGLFSIDAVVVPERNSSGSVEVIAKISAGASAWLPVVSVVNLVRFTEKLKQQGFWIFGADADGQPLYKTSFPKKTAIIMGSEGQGISKLLQKNCDVIVSIPTNGRLDSLNVSVAAGILLYEISKRNFMQS